HVVGAHTLKDIAEQIKRPVSVRCRRTCSGAHQKCVGLRQQQCCHNADQCTEENQGSFAHHCHHGLGSMGAPSLRCHRRSGSRVAHSCEMGRCKPGRQISCTTAPRV